MHDVAVVGCGPAGSSCARRLEKAGLEVVVLEAKPVVGVPVQCSGLISKNLDKYLKVPRSCIQNMVKGAVIHGPGGAEIRLRKPTTTAYVLDRERLDQHLASRLESPVRLETSVRKLDFSGKGVTLRTSDGEVKARSVVGCDGPGSVVRKHFRVKPPETLGGVMAVTDEKDSSDEVEIWADRDVCDGFLWRIPRGESVEYGMIGSGVKFIQLEKFFRLDPRNCSKGAGMIPTGGCKSYFPRALLIGDAAAQTKPWSGGGVIYNLICSKLAAQTLIKALGEGDLSEERLSGYEDAWKKEIGRSISMGMMGREIYKEMDNAHLKSYMKSLAKQDLNKLDLDRPEFSF